MKLELLKTLATILLNLLLPRAHACRTTRSCREPPGAAPGQPGSCAFSAQGREPRYRSPSGHTPPSAPVRLPQQVAFPHWLSCSEWKIENCKHVLNEKQNFFIMF